MKWKFLVSLLTTSCLCIGCSAEETAEGSSIETTFASDSTETSAIKNTPATTRTQQTQQTTTEIIETIESTGTSIVTTIVQETETEIDRIESAESVQWEMEMQTYDAAIYGCTLEIPSGWIADYGVSGMEFVESTCIFQPETPNGDSISVLVQSEAEDSETFSALTADVIVQAYADSMDSLSVTSMESIAISGFPAYLVTMDGKSGGVPIVMTQIYVNHIDETMEYLLILTFADVSGVYSNYADTMLSHFYFNE